MQSLSDEELVEIYQLATQLQLEEAFIQLIRKEFIRRGFGSTDDSGAGRCEESKTKYVWAS